MAATVGGESVTVAEVDARERALRAGGTADALPRPGTSEARQLRRWITQVLVAERVVAAEASALWRCVTKTRRPSGICCPTRSRGWRSAASQRPRCQNPAAARCSRASPPPSASATPRCGITTAAIRSASPSRPAAPGGWHGAPVRADLDDVRPAIAAHLLAAARRREYRRWLDARCADAVVLAPGYEHPGDPRQPDNTHRH